MPSIVYPQLWQAEAAAGSLVVSGYFRRNGNPRAGEVRVLRGEDGFTVEWVPFVWDLTMLERLALLDASCCSDLREAASGRPNHHALRLLSREFPDPAAALAALELLEGEGPC